MKANGVENTSSLTHRSVKDILHLMYNVGTEKSKIFSYPAEPKDEELIPLRLMDITSDNKKQKKN